MYIVFEWLPLCCNLEHSRVVSISFHMYTCTIDPPMLAPHSAYHNTTLTFCEDDISVVDHPFICCIHAQVESGVYRVISDEPEGSFGAFEACNVYRLSNAVCFHAEGLLLVRAAPRRQTTENLAITIAHDEGIVFTCG